MRWRLPRWIFALLFLVGCQTVQTGNADLNAPSSTGRTDTTVVTKGWLGLDHFSKDTGEFSYCAVGASFYDGEISFIFIIDFDGERRVGIRGDKKGWNLTDGKRYRVRLGKDRLDNIPYSAEAFSHELLSIRLNAPAFYDRLANGDNRLYVEFRDVEQPFNFANIEIALAWLENCARRHDVPGWRGTTTASASATQWSGDFATKVAGTRFNGQRYFGEDNGGFSFCEVSLFDPEELFLVDFVGYETGNIAIFLESSSWRLRPGGRHWVVLSTGGVGYDAEVEVTENSRNLVQVLNLEIDPARILERNDSLSLITDTSKIKWRWDKGREALAWLRSCIADNKDEIRRPSS